MFILWYKFIPESRGLYTIQTLILYSYKIRYYLCIIKQLKHQNYEVSRSIKSSERLRN